MEKVILVDVNDKAIGVMEKLQAHKEGLLHRAFSVFILILKMKCYCKKEQKANIIPLTFGRIPAAAIHDQMNKHWFQHIEDCRKKWD